MGKRAKKTSLQVDIDTNMVVSQIYCDICNGLTTNDCITKLTEGMYEIGRYKDNPVSSRTAYRLIHKALDLMKEESEQERTTLRSVMYNRLLAVYQDSIQNNDRSNAIRSLEVMGKLTGMFNTENQTNVLINNNKDNVTIQFGFNNED